MINTSSGKAEVSLTRSNSYTDDRSQDQDKPLLDTQDQFINVTKKTWSQRTFGKMNKGSVRASIIALMSCAMGSGILAFPSNARSSGIILATILMIVCALISRLMMYLLMACSFKAEVSSYTEMVEYTFGKKIRKIYELDVILYIFGALVCFQIMFTTFLWEACIAFGVNEDNETTYKLLFSFGFIILNLPISLLRDVYQLRYFTQLQLLVIAYICIAMTIYFFQTYDATNTKEQVVYFKFNVEFFSSFATTFFGYICHQLLFPLRQELHSTSFRRMGKVCNRSVFLTFLIYSLVMMVGYLTWFNASQSLIINNYNNMYFTVAKVLMALALFFGVPINLNPLRLTFLECIEKQDSKRVYIISTIVIQVSSGVLALVYPNVKSGFGFLGGFLGTNMVVVFPCAIYLKTFGWRSSRCIAILIVCTISTLFGYTGAITSQIYKN